MPHTARERTAVSAARGTRRAGRRSPPRSASRRHATRPRRRGGQAQQSLHRSRRLRTPDSEAGLHGHRAAPLHARQEGSAGHSLPALARSRLTGTAGAQQEAPPLPASRTAVRPPDEGTRHRQTQSWKACSSTDSFGRIHPLKWLTCVVAGAVPRTFTVAPGNPRRGDPTCRHDRTSRQPASRRPRTGLAHTRSTRRWPRSPELLSTHVSRDGAALELRGRSGGLARGLRRPAAIRCGSCPPDDASG